MNAELNEVYNEIEKSIKGFNVKEILDLLGKLKDREVTKEEIISSKLGIQINQIRKRGDDESITKLAESILLKWKPIMTLSGKESSLISKRTIQEEENSDEKKRAKSDESKSSSSGLDMKDKMDKSINDEESEDIKKEINWVSLEEYKRSLEPFLTTSDTRNKCIEMLVKALLIDFPVKTGYCLLPDELLLSTAHSIEAALFNEFGETSTDYKAKFRSKYLNLSSKISGQHLRYGLLNGAIKPLKFCSMTPAEMASEERKKEIEELRLANLQASQAARDTQAETDQFKCGRCGKRKCKYYQLQTRSADEPMTTFVTCVNCGNRWKFC